MDNQTSSADALEAAMNSVEAHVASIHELLDHVERITSAMQDRIQRLDHLTSRVETLRERTGTVVQQAYSVLAGDFPRACETAPPPLKVETPPPRFASKTATTARRR